MRVDKPGVLPKQQQQRLPEALPPYWLGCKVECPKCHGVFTLQASDAPAHFVNFAIRCQTKGCGAYIRVHPNVDRAGKIG